MNEDPRKLPRSLLIILIVTTLVIVFALGFKLGDYRATRQSSMEDRQEDFVWGDGIRQGCEWCGGRCDGYMRGWRRAEEEERRGTRP